MEATGNFADKDWNLIGPDGRLVGRISRQWFSVRDAYGVEVGPGEDDALVISIAVCIDRIHEDEERGSASKVTTGYRRGTCRAHALQPRW